MTIIKSGTITLDFDMKKQMIDGFGVNINAKYWNNGQIKPVIDLLVDDLGAIIFRLDHYGNANWVDPNNCGDASLLNAANYNKIYQTDEFQNALGLSLYLNSKGIEPYITVSGIVPQWMCEADGITLSKYDMYAEMVVDYLAWLRNNEVKFKLFGPLNETDFGPPEGPSLSPEGYLEACRAIINELDARGMDDVMLVVPEQGEYNLNYVNVLFSDEDVARRIGVIGMHAYWDFHVDELMSFTKGKTAHVRNWMTEFGDLSQSNEQEDHIAWVCLERLFRLISDGMNGAMVWDAFDNYHDHDQAWTTYGILKNALNTYIPKKRYYALKHIFKFVRPGFRRVEVVSTLPEIKLLAFENEATREITVVGMNPCDEGCYMDLNLKVKTLDGRLNYLNFNVYRTNEFEDCAKVTSPIVKLQPSQKGFEFTVLPKCIFTVTGKNAN